jgi:hypothetical protein
MTWYADAQDFLDRCKDAGDWQVTNAIILAYNQGRVDQRATHRVEGQLTMSDINSVRWEAIREAIEAMGLEVREGHWDDTDSGMDYIEVPSRGPMSRENPCRRFLVVGPQAQARSLD